MPLNAIARTYRKRVVGNPWLYHAKWWIRDVAESGMMQAKIKIADLKSLAATFARTISFTARMILDQTRNKF